MKAVIQRVKNARVTVHGEAVGAIGAGILLFLGISGSDSEKDIEWIVEKVSNIRIFEGKSGKMDLSVRDMGGSILIVSQFTLYGKCDKGRRPNFEGAASIDKAQELYQKAVGAFKQTGIPIEEGRFQAHMKVELVNDGPVTFILESPQT